MSLVSQHIIDQCKRQDSQAQKELYENYKDLFYAICLRYIKSPQDAEDVFIDAFYKILTKVDLYKGEGSFEGWMKRIVINESLMFLRKKSNLYLTVEIPDREIADEVVDTEADFTFDEIISIIEEMPVGYRTVFNLYVFEEYKHREIAEILGISINTSKSQLILAKKRLVEILKKKQNPTFKFYQ